MLQLLAAALNFAVVVVQSRPAFALPFKSLDDMLVTNPFVTAAADRAASPAQRMSGERDRAMKTPREPMPRVAS